MRGEGEEQGLKQGGALEPEDSIVDVLSFSSLCCKLS